MSLVATTYSARMRCCACTVAVVVLLVCAPAAYADGGVQCVGITAYQELDAVSAVPSDFAKIYVEFDKNVSFAQPGTDDAWIEENLSRVHVLDSKGVPVASAAAHAVYDRGERRHIPIWIDEWLAPLSEYRVVVDAGIIAANGQDVLEAPCEFSFKTDASCENGLSVYENVLLIGVPLLLALGVAAQAVRMRGRVQK